MQKEWWSTWIDKDTNSLVIKKVAKDGTTSIKYISMYDLEDMKGNSPLFLLAKLGLVNDLTVQTLAPEILGKHLSLQLIDDAAHYKTDLNSWFLDPEVVKIAFYDNFKPDGFHLTDLGEGYLVPTEMLKDFAGSGASKMSNYYQQFADMHYKAAQEHYGIDLANSKPATTTQALVNAAYADEQDAKAYKKAAANQLYSLYDSIMKSYAMKADHLALIVHPKPGDVLSAITDSLPNPSVDT